MEIGGAKATQKAKRRCCQGKCNAKNIAGDKMVTAPLQERACQKETA
jgi:hypothetical protein